MEPSVLELILDGKSEPTNLPLALLENITGNFAEERIIGKSEFGTIYKGVLPNGNIAVKRIMSSFTNDGNKFLYREVNSMLDVCHKNVVRFLGYCDNTEKIAIKIDGSRKRVFAKKRERILCFEHVNNGDLDKHMTDELRGLEWNTRYQIIKDICNGLNHLHKEKKIIHMDLKPSNILLDHHMVPKICDFGLSRLEEYSRTIFTTHFVTLGYSAPENLNGGDRMSLKSDMYSLGVLIIELVTGNKGVPNKNDVLRRWRHRWRKSGKVTPWGYQQITKCIEIGTLCMEIDLYKRPFIWDVIRDINEIDVTNGQISNVDEIIPYTEDDMLGIEPLELHFPFELNKLISCSLELTNDTDACIAFNIKNTSPLTYCIEPNKGIILPQCKCSVQITLQALGKEPEHIQQAYAFILQSTKVKDGLEAEDITADMFIEKIGNVVDEVSLDVVLDAQVQSKLAHKLEPPLPLEPNNLTPVVLKLEVLKAITGNFSTTSELGRGAYGVVYKGVFPSGEIIAVKMLKSHLVEDETFQNEVSYLTGIKHRHVVQPVGYCAESSWELMPQPTGRPLWFEVPKRLICFEYVCNKSLDNYISDESTGLDWNMRYEIIKGICNGLHFLHEECRIVHLDLKPENIMMDAAFMPKITDFGLSRIFGNKETRIFTDNRLGTRGYMAPEYTIQGLITTKADIFSLGVVIIQIVTGHKDYPLGSSYFQLFNTNNTPMSTDISFKDFSEKVVGSWRKKFKLTSKYKSTEKYIKQVERCIEIALKCVDLDKEKRPTANDIIKWLNCNRSGCLFG